MHPPRLIHFIWFGSSLPVQYELNIVSFIRFNPAFTIIVYVDQQIEQTRQRFRMYPTIIIRHYCEIYEELGDAYPKANVGYNHKFLEAERALPGGNLAAASDIFRLDLLYYFGGYYLDTDIYCIKPLATVEVLNGLRVNTIYGKYASRTGDGINNDILIATPKATVVEDIRKQVHENYLNAEALGEEKGLAGFFTKRLIALKHFVIITSGPTAIAKVLIRETYAKYLQSTMIIPSFFSQSLKITCDNSWLPAGLRTVQSRHQQMQDAAKILQAVSRGYLDRQNLLKRQTKPPVF